MSKRPTYFTVGPAQVYPTLAQHMHNALASDVPSVSHRSARFRSMYQHVVEQLQELLQLPDDMRVFFMPSATEIWERSIQNLVVHQSYHCVQGAFARKYHNYAHALGKQTQHYTVPDGMGFDSLATLRVPQETELICFTQNETSTGIHVPPQELSLVKHNNPHSLLCVDIVSSAPLAALPFHDIDSAFFSVQKAFGMPAGLGVWLVNQRCIEQAEIVQQKSSCKTAHHTIGTFEKNFQKMETPSTPNVLAIFLLGKIAEDINKHGIDNYRAQAQRNYNMLSALCNANSAFSFTTDKVQHHSHTVSVLGTTHNTNALLDYCKQHNCVVSAGYGDSSITHIRIANFPAISTEHMEQLVEVLQNF